MANDQWLRALLFFKVLADDKSCIVDILGTRTLLVVLRSARRWRRLILRTVETEQRATYDVAILLTELLGKFLHEGVVCLLCLAIFGGWARGDE